MRTKLVCGKRMVAVDLPDEAVLVEQDLATPIPPVADVGRAVRDALAAPLDSPTLRELARPGLRVTLAFDDPTVPCFAPVWATAIGAVIEELTAGGVALTDIRLLCANALHRQFTHAELAGILGPDLVKTFGDRLGCHDAEDPDGIVQIGATAAGHPVELARQAVECDLLVYVNAACWRGFNGGWKSICVGLSTYRSIRVHHNPHDMSMSTERNRMHDILDEMGEVAVRALGERHFFKIETVLANPMQVGRMWAGSVGATRRTALELLRSRVTARRDLLADKVDILVYGVPEWSPYAAFAGMNPLLRLVSTGLGYLGGPIEGIGAPGCTVILATPSPDEWDLQHHPSYREVWDRVLPESRDPDWIDRHHMDAYAARADYIEQYRHHNAFHPTHGIMATFPLKRLRHAGRVILAGPGDDAVAARLGFTRLDTVEQAIAAARAFHGASPKVGVVRYPFAANRA